MSTRSNDRDYSAAEDAESAENQVFPCSITKFGTDPHVAVLNNEHNPTTDYSLFGTSRKLTDCHNLLHHVVNGSINNETLACQYGVSGIREKVVFETSNNSAMEIQILSIQCRPKMSCIICAFPTEKRAEFNKLTSILTDWFSAAGDLREVEQPQYHKIYLAKFDKFECFFRAQLIENNNNKFKILYIDYGNIDTVDSLFLLPTVCARSYFHVTRTSPFAIPFVVAAKPDRFHKFTKASINSVFLIEGQTAQCRIDGIAVAELSFLASVSIYTAKGYLNLKDILVTEPSCFCCSIL